MLMKQSYAGQMKMVCDVCEPKQDNNIYLLVVTRTKVLSA